jgi:hypothetical protein
MPWSSITSIETIPAVGAAPTWRRGGACGETGDERAVPAPVSRRVSGQRRQVDLREHAIAEVGAARLDSGVDERDRRRSEPASGLAGLEERPELVDADGAGPELGRGVRRVADVLTAAEPVEHDRLVGNDREARALRELRQVAGSNVGGRSVDDREARGRVGEVVERLPRSPGTVVTHHDHGHVAIGRALRDLRQGWGQVAPGARVLVAGAGCKRRAEREQRNGQERPSPCAPAAAVSSSRTAPEPAGTGLAAASAYATHPARLPLPPDRSLLRTIRKPISDPSP